MGESLRVTIVDEPGEVQEIRRLNLVFVGDRLRPARPRRQTGGHGEEDKPKTEGPNPQKRHVMTPFTVR